MLSVSIAVGWHHATRKGILLIGSYFFYMTWDVRLAGLLIWMTLINYIAGNQIFGSSLTRQRIWLTISLVASLATLGYFKYTNFFLTSLNETAKTIGISWHINLLELIIPVGISFITFQAITYPLDVYGKKISKPATLLDYSLFVAFFPKLLSGPITRASQFLPQLETSTGYDDRFAMTGLTLIFRGLVRKAFIADNLATYIVDPAFSSPTSYSSLFLLFALFAFSFQIYMDLAGYTDIARGVSRLFGYELPINFNRPYLATSVSNFWQRWHISMSSFFRDYLFFSLGGSKYGNVYLNLLATFVAIGFWHGAGWNFILYGMIHGTLVAIERFRRKRREKLGIVSDRLKGLRLSIRILQTFTIVSVTRVLFRGDDITSAWEYLGAMLTLQQTGFPVHILGMGAFISAAILHFTPSRWSESAVQWISELRPAFYAPLAVLLIYALTAFLGDEATFIYFQF